MAGVPLDEGMKECLCFFLGKPSRIDFFNSRSTHSTYPPFTSLRFTNLRMMFNYPTVLCRVQITPKTCTSSSQGLYSREPVRHSPTLK